MNLKLITLFALFYSIINLNAQNVIDVDIIKSEFVKEKRFKKAYGGLFQTRYEVSDNNGGLVVVQMVPGGYPIQKPKSYLIYHYSEDLKLKSEIEYEIKRGFASLDGVFVSDDEIKLLQLTVSKSNKKNCDMSLISAKLDSNDFKTKVLFSASKKEMGVNTARNPYSPIRSFYSKNEKLLLLTVPLIRKKEKFLRNIVFNKQLNLISDNVFKHGMDDSSHIISILDNNGIGYSLVRDFKEKKGKQSSYTIFKSSEQGVDKKTISPDKFLKIPSIALQKSNLVVASLASDKKGGEKGVYLSFIDLESMNTVNNVYHEFSNNYLKDKFGKVKKNYKGSSNLILDKIYIDSLDNIHIVNQELDIASVQNTNINTGLPTGNGHTFYNYNDVSYININSDGSLKWMKNLKNKRAKANYIFYNDTVYIFFKGKDSVRRGDKNIFSGFGDSTALNIYAANILDSRKLLQKKIIDRKNLKLKIENNEDITILNKFEGELLLSIEKGANNQYIKIELK